MLKYTCWAALALRAFLIVWSEVQDSLLTVKYTDVDYHVFTDAARHVVNGGSPYDRPTYRYSPLLAWILTPNILLQAQFGKVLFSLLDVLNGLLIYRDVSTRFGPDEALKSLRLWLFNPITLAVSTRGNAESLITLAVLATLHLHRKSAYLASGLCLGLAVHLKIYPIIYCLVFYTATGSRSDSLVDSLWPTRGRIALVLGFCASLAALSTAGYYLYGWPFLQETYLYHIGRQDVRHNFSPYFYPLYLSSQSTFASLAAFAPQVIAVLLLSYRYRSAPDLSWALFVLTYAFVTFNKVVTSQYFLWYISLLPLSLAELGDFVGSRAGKVAGIAWLASQGLWLFFAYQLEFLGRPVLLAVWLASLLFFGVNVAILIRCIKSRKSSSNKEVKQD